jgi:hypothetical protein
VHRTRNLLLAALLVSGAALSPRPALATASTVFWTPATTYVQPFLVPHFTYDTFFGERGSYPIFTGLTIGVLPFEKLQAEVGFDLQLPGYSGSPNYQGSEILLLNAKLGIPDAAFAAWQPGISAGIMAAGVRSRTRANMLHAELGKALPFGTVAVGGYYGLEEELWVDENLDEDRAGLLASYVTPDWNVSLPGLTKVNAFADVQTGQNAFGAVGAGAGLYFTPAIALLAGPVFFLNRDVQPGGSSMMWSLQVDVDVDAFRRGAPASPPAVPSAPIAK